MRGALREVCQRLVGNLQGRVPPLGWSGLAHGIVELAEETGPVEPEAFTRALRDFGLSPTERFVVAAVLAADLDSRFVGAWQLLGGRVDCVRPRLSMLLQLARPEDREHVLALTDPLSWLRATGLLHGGDSLDQPLGVHPALLGGTDGEAAAMGVSVEGARVALPPGRRVGAHEATAFIIEGPVGSGRATRAKQLAGGGIAYVLLDPIRGATQLQAAIRVAVMRGVVPVVDLGDVSHTAFASLLAQLREYAGPFFVIAEARPLFPAPWHTRVVSCNRPDVPARAQLWREAGITDQADELARRFPLGQGAIFRAAAEARYRGVDDTSLAQAAREQLETRSLLSERVRTTRTLADLVAPTATTALISEIIEFARHRREVFEDWGFGKRVRGGLKVLFSGPPGTGKTMSAEIIAAELDLDLFRIDLSNIVSKWVGETEKNLKQVFDHAETNGGVLLFDEADSLFGKRTTQRAVVERSLREHGDQLPPAAHGDVRGRVPPDHEHRVRHGRSVSPPAQLSRAVRDARRDRAHRAVGADDPGASATRRGPRLRGGRRSIRANRRQHPQRRDPRGRARRRGGAGDRDAPLARRRLSRVRRARTDLTTSGRL